jgi:hypothetical protein
VINAISLRRQRDLGAIFNDAFSLLFAGTAGYAWMVAPAILVNIALTLVAFGLDEEPLLRDGVLFVSLPIRLVAYQLVSAAVIASLDARDRGRAIASGDALDVAQSRFGDVVSASLRSTAIVFLLGVTVIGIPWAIKRVVKWAFIVQSIIVDGQRGEPSLAYSEALVRGHWWRTFGLLTTITLFGLMATLVLSQIVLVVVPGLGGVILAHAVDLLVLPFGIIATTLIFFDLKQRKGPDDDLSAA